MEILAGIKIKKTTFWCFGEGDLWLLNLNKMDTTLISEKALNMRENHLKLDETNILSFLSEIKEIILPIETLRKNFFTNKNLYPALYIDFDKKVFYDNFPEPNNFYAALDDRWTYSYRELEEVVEKEEQFWINH